jgi:hypothetical protein
MRRHISTRTRLLLGLCVLIGVLGPTPVLAHVKWFENASNYPLRLDLVVSDRSLLWMVSSTLAVVALYLTQRWLPKRRWPWNAWLKRMSTGATTVLAIQAAIGLISSAVQPALLAPNLALKPDVVGTLLAALEILIALSFVTGIADWLGGCLLICLVVLIGVMFSPVDALEQTFWVGIGAVMIMIGRDVSPASFLRQPAAELRRRAITALQVATGLSLIIVALTEKLWNPDLGLAFLADRPYLNVMQTLPGFSWFSNDLFVLAAGLTEAALGALLISGFAPRLVILAMWLPFNLGIPVLPSVELLGHLPILGIMYMLLVQDNAPVRVPVARPWRVAAVTAPFAIGAATVRGAHGGIAATVHSTSGRERQLAGVR